MEERTYMVRPTPIWERYLHKNGKFAFEFDATRGVIRCVDRGGTIEYDLAARMAEAQQNPNTAIDNTANTTH